MRILQVACNPTSPRSLQTRASRRGRWNGNTSAPTQAAPKALPKYPSCTRDAVVLIEAVDCAWRPIGEGRRTIRIEPISGFPRQDLWPFHQKAFHTLLRVPQELGGILGV
jgi:hypothetical protein